ncbi:lytic transglycosylase domain-containing protein [Dactylosporangium aurantiacum]|uniref:Lytic transglycosylase domain-containing protein n=1 Tax=Dactylosporangium aurantiacum TaxID=35754 RepID=A0A9Q9IND8_9ACTN|nr:lytic transglycosylase domain-containing protein [Dactylosporangium aurantiacum]
MTLLWQRVGKIRVLAVLALVAALAAGVVVATWDSGKKVDPVNAAADAALPRATDGAPASPSASAPASEQASAQSKAQDAAAAAAAQAKAAEDAARKKKEEEETSRSVTRTLGPPTYPIPAACDIYKGKNDNKWRGCGLLHVAGFGIDQMGPCLEKLWDKESHWTTTARNRSSGAYGIAQALPGSKMASVASDWSWNPETQIKWGLGYIKGRYKTPCAAWSHSQSTGWY